MYINKDYQLVHNILLKTKLNESKHLLHSKGSVPAIDADMWDKHKGQILTIKMYTNKSRLFKVKGNKFDKYKEEIDFGFGRQYIIPLEHWEIMQLNSKEKAPRQEASSQASLLK